MNTHLSDDDFAAAVAGLDVDTGVREHLASCVGCRQQVADVQVYVADRRRAFETEAPDWELQRKNVMALLTDAPAAARPSGSRWLRPVLAVAAALLVAVGLRLAAPPSEVVPPVDDDLPIEQILAEVDAVLADDGLPGFEPIDPGVDDPASLFENGAS